MRTYRRANWLNPASSLCWAINLALRFGATIRTHRRLPAFQHKLWQ